MEMMFGIRFGAKNETGDAIDDVGKDVKKLESGIVRSVKRSQAAFRRMGVEFFSAAQSVGRAFASMARAASSFKDGLSKVSSKLGTALGSVGAAAGDVAMALGNVVIESSATQDAVFLLSQRLGESVESMTALGSVASSVAGVGLDEFSAAMTDLSARAVNQTDAFKKWGIQTRGSTGQVLSSSALLGNVADRMAKLSTQAEKVALADELMGEAGRRLVPMLQQGSEALDAQAKAAIEAGLAMTDFEARAGNELQTQIGATTGALQSMGSAITGQLAPALSVIAKNLGEVAGQAAGWIRTNQALIQSGIREFLMFLADSVIPAIATGVLLLSKVWYGWKLVIDAVRLILTSYWKAIADGIDMALGKLQALAEVAGIDTLTEKIQTARSVVQKFGSVFGESANEAKAGLLETMRDIEASEKAIDSLGVKGSEAVRKVASQVLSLTKGLKETREQAKKTGAAVVKAGDEIRRKFGNAVASQFETNKRILDMQMRDLETFDSLMTQAQEKAAEDAAALFDAMHSGFNSVLEVGREAFAGIGEEVNGRVKTMTDAFAQFFGGLGSMLAKSFTQFALAQAKEALLVKASATSQVTANAAKAGSGAAASQAGIPVIGPYLALGAMAAMVAAVLGLLGTFNTGGIVGGSGANMDSRLIMATPGEGILDREATAHVIRSLTGRGGARGAPIAQPIPSDPSLGSSTREAPGASVTLGLLAMPTNRTDIRRTLRDLQSELREMDRAGLSRKGRAGRRG